MESGSGASVSVGIEEMLGCEDWLSGSAGVVGVVFNAFSSIVVAELVRLVVCVDSVWVEGGHR